MEYHSIDGIEFNLKFTIFEKKIFQMNKVCFSNYFMNLFLVSFEFICCRSDDVYMLKLTDYSSDYDNNRDASVHVKALH